jgi:ADP-heptose:LPS heptosyltransferase
MQTWPPVVEDKFKDILAFILWKFHEIGLRRIGVNAPCEKPRDSSIHKMSVLVTQTNFIGDAVFALPLIHALKNNKSVSSIGAITSPSSHQVLSRFIGHGSCYLLPSSLTVTKAVRLLSLIQRIKKKQFDVAICLDRNPKGLILSYLAGINRRVGFTGGAPSWAHPPRYEFLYTSSLPTSDGSRHRFDQNLDLLNLLGIDRGSHFEGLPLTPEDFRCAEHLFDGIGMRADDTKILIHPGARIAPKRWPAKNWGQLIDRLTQSGELKILIACGPDDEKQVSEVFKCVRGKIPFVLRSESIFGLAAAAVRSDLFIGADSGPLHLAAASGAKCVGLYSYACPNTFGPLRSLSKIIKSSQLCRSCWPETCSIDLCIRGIEVDTVFEAAIHQLHLNSHDKEL